MHLEHWQYLWLWVQIGYTDPHAVNKDEQEKLLAWLEGQIKGF